MSAFKYPNKNSNIITIKITPTIPNIQNPSRTVNCSTVFLLPLDGHWLCMRMVGQRFKNQTWSSHASSGLTLQVIEWNTRHLEVEAQLRRVAARRDVVRSAEG